MLQAAPDGVVRLLMGLPDRGYLLVGSALGLVWTITRVVWSSFILRSTAAQKPGEAPPVAAPSA
jgi:hypothetical protein